MGRAAQLCGKLEAMMSGQREYRNPVPGQPTHHAISLLAAKIETPNFRSALNTMDWRRQNTHLQPFRTGSIRNHNVWWSLRFFLHQ
jgi:hypothetical protein